MCRGYNIGIRLIDEFLAKAKIAKCANFKETTDIVAKQALPMFLNIQATVSNWSPDGMECSLVRLCSCSTCCLPCLDPCLIKHCLRTLSQP